MYFCVNEIEVGVNDSMFSGNEQQKAYLPVQIYAGITSLLTPEHFGEGSQEVMVTLHFRIRAKTNP